MEELDGLHRKEIAIQELIYKDSALQVDIPLHSAIFSLDEMVRLDRSMANKILFDEEYINECERDIGDYIKSIDYLSEDQKMELRLENFQKFSTEWEFSFSQSKYSHFLDLIWNDGYKKHELGYIDVPTFIFNYKKSPALCKSAEDNASEVDMHPNSLIFGRENLAEASLILFENPAKFIRFNGNKEAKYELERKNNKITMSVFTFSSSHLENIPQAIILRNFGVRYLNKLVSLALEPNS